VLESQAKYKVVVAGRRSGKTTLAIAELIYNALVKPAEYWYVSPSYKQSKQIAWKMLLEKLQELGVPYKKNEVDLSAVIGNAVIKLKGAEDADSLRGSKVAGMVLDECAFWDEFDYKWNNVLLPSLADSNGWCIFISTPNGFNDFYDLYGKYEHFTAKSSDNSYLSPDALVDMRLKMHPDQAKQELDAEFIAQGSYQYFIGIDKIVGDISLNPQTGHTYTIGCDLGRYHDSTILIAVSQQSNEVHGYESFDDTDWPMQKYRIANFARKYNNGTITIDYTNEKSVAEDLMAEGIGIEEFVFTTKSKIEIFEKLRLYIQNQDIKIPNIPKLVLELNKFEFRLQPALKLGVQSEHDDTCCALALAVKNLNKPEVQVDRARIYKY